MPGKAPPARRWGGAFRTGDIVFPCSGSLRIHSYTFLRSKSAKMLQKKSSHSFRLVCQACFCSLVWQWNGLLAAITLEMHALSTMDAISMPAKPAGLPKRRGTLLIVDDEE